MSTKRIIKPRVGSQNLETLSTLDNWYEGVDPMPDGTPGAVFDNPSSMRMAGHTDVRQPWMLPLSGGWTINVWVRDATTYAYVLGPTCARPRPGDFPDEGAYQYRFVSGANNNISFSTETVTVDFGLRGNGAWDMMTVALEIGGDLVAYVNGSLRETVAGPFPAPTVAGNLHFTIGHLVTAAWEYSITAAFSDVQWGKLEFYDRALTAQEVSDLYDARLS